MVMQTPKKRVVIVDDDADLRSVLKAAISTLPCEVVGEGGSGAEAVTLYRQHRPDLLMLDVNMPGVTGTQALTEIRKEFPTAFVVMLTANADLETVRECIRKGAARYILKDTSMARIRVTISEVLGLGAL